MNWVQGKEELSSWDLRSLYYEALKPENSRMVVRSLASIGGFASFSDIEKTSGVRGSTLVYHLNRLIAYGLVSTPSKGAYELVYKTPFCQPWGDQLEVAYFGLLGRRSERHEPEPEVARALLAQNRLRVDTMHVVTSPDALSEWSSDRLPYEWILCYEDEIIDVEKVVMKMEKPLVDLLKKSIVVLDCTSATKPASLAFYQLAEKYLVPLIYVYEERRELRWLLSVENIFKQLNVKTQVS